MRSTASLISQRSQQCPPGDALHLSRTGEYSNRAGKVALTWLGDGGKEEDGCERVSEPSPSTSSIQSWLQPEPLQRVAAIDVQCITVSECTEYPDVQLPKMQACALSTSRQAKLFLQLAPGQQRQIRDLHLPCISFPCPYWSQLTSHAEIPLIVPNHRGQLNKAGAPRGCWDPVIFC